MDVTTEIAADIDALVGSTGGTVVAMGGAYEGADRTNKALALWAPPLQSIDADILPAKGTADARTRDVGRNDGYVQAGITLHKDSIVGALYMLNSRPNTQVLGLDGDEKWAEEFQAEVEAKFTAWAESVNKWPDAARTNDLTAMVRLAVGVYCMGGEVLATAEWMRDKPRPYRTAVQMIDTDRLKSPYSYENERNVRGGVRMDRYGAPISYFIRTSHPSDFLRPYDDPEFREVPVRKPWGRKQVLHIKEQMRPDQTRGIADLVAGLKTTKIASKFRDLVLQNAATNAMFAASIESELPPEAAFASLGGGNVGTAITDYASAYLGAIAEYAGNSKHMALDGVRIPHLFPGSKLQLRPAGTPGGVGQDFEASLLRHLSAILGISYEELSHDYSKTNYSSSKAAKGGTQQAMATKKKSVADGMADFVFDLWFEEALNAGDITTVSGYSKAPNFYEGLNREAYTGAEWVGAGINQIDELKETQAAALRMKYNLSTLEQEAARLGKNWRKLIIQREIEKKELEARGLEADPQDNSLNAASGEAREKDAA